MTCGVTMLFYVLHTRPITDGKRVCERCHGAAAPLPAGRAVTELQAAGLRLALARQLVAGLDDKSATMTTSAVVAIADGAKIDLATACDNKLTRSVKKIIVRYKRGPKRGGGFIKGGYPFMFISPFDIKLKCITRGVSRTDAASDPHNKNNILWMKKRK